MADVYPLLLLAPELDDKFDSKLHFHGITHDQYRKWFKSRKEAIEFCENDIDSRELELKVQEYKAQLWASDNTIQNASKQIAHSQAFDDYIQLIHDQDFGDVLKHYVQESVV